MLQPDAGGHQVDSVLKLWAHHWKSPEAIAEARRLASSAGAEQRLAYATYFIDVGSPDDAIALVGDTPKLPLQISNLQLEFGHRGRADAEGPADGGEAAVRRDFGQGSRPRVRAYVAGLSWK